MKLVITAGGGGHFAPVLAILDQLPKDTQILIIGRKYAFEGMKTLSLEYTTAKENNIPFISLVTGRLQRAYTRYTLTSFLKTPIGLIQSLYILLRFRPDVVFSTGGYVTVPVCLAAFILRIPIVIHEQTLGAGLSNKIVSYFAKTICVSFEESLEFYPKQKTIVSGNPIRQEIINPPKIIPSIITKDFLASSDCVIYITGGSLGSHEINLAVEACLPKLLKKYRIIHQTGDAEKFGDYNRLKNFKSNRYIPVQFVNPIYTGSILRISDLVISRAGMNSILEFICAKKPAILIPLLSTQKNEQVKNAKYFADLELGKILNDANLSSESLYKEIEDLITNINKYKDKFEESFISVHVNAAKKIVDILISTIKR